MGRCCDRCRSVVSREYLLDGDGDGVEFLTEVAATAAGDDVTSTVVYR